MWVLVSLVTACSEAFYGGTQGKGDASVMNDAFAGSAGSAGSSGVDAIEQATGGAGGSWWHRRRVGGRNVRRHARCIVD
jgi:hypothetical protein